MPGKHIISEEVAFFNVIGMSLKNTFKHRKENNLPVLWHFSHILSTYLHQHVCSHWSHDRSKETLCWLPFHWLSWPSSSFPTLPATGCIIWVFVQTQVEPSLKIYLQTLSLCAPGEGSSMWFISNPAFSPALLHSEVPPLKHFLINGRVQRHTSSCCPCTHCHFVQWLLRLRTTQSCL